MVRTYILNCSGRKMRSSFLNIVKLSAFITCATIGAIIYISTTPWLVSRPTYSANESNRHPLGLYNSNIEYLVPEKKEQHHVIFIKVHKAASSTVQNIMLRFSLARNLSALLPKDPKSHVNEHGSDINPAHILPHPTGGRHFDILCDHILFNEDIIAQYFPEDTVRIAIVRDPLQQALSALNYFSHIFKKADIMAGLEKFKEDPIQGFVTHPEQFYDPRQSVTFSYINNRMSVDLGFDRSNFEESKRNLSKIQDFVTSLEKQFDLILITEFFDESMVMLRRSLNWSFKDIMYLEANTATDNQEGFQTSKFNQRPSFNSSTMLSFRRWAAIDYALYTHFLTIFLNKIRSEDYFQDEVNAFREARNLVAKFCSQVLKFQTKGREYTTVAKTEWNEAFTVSESDCELMNMHEINLMGLAIERQKERTFKKN